MRSATPRARPVKPRQKRARQTRAALLAAVERIVAAEGAEAVTTTRVAAETGLAVGTIYRYFEDREALLLAAYDATVLRIVERCRTVLGGLSADMPITEAARHLLDAYLDTAEAVPAHAGLLRAMRAIRPVEADQDQGNGPAIIANLLAPFLERFAGSPAALSDPARLRFMNALLGTLVDLYLMTPRPGGRVRLRGEIEAHMLLLLERTLAGE